MKKLLLTLSLLLLPFSLHAAPKADLWERWLEHDPASTQTINHTNWQQFLSNNLKVNGSRSYLDYSDIPAADRALLADYLSLLSTTPISQFNRSEQQAFWINLYNALTVETILNHYPVSSITDIDISPGWFSNGPWGKKLIRVEATELSLDDIEHRILRPIWQDPRIHYAVNCASLGCPMLQPSAFTPENSEHLLNQGATAFINSSQGVTLSNKSITLSKIYDWFAKDFGRNETELLEHITQYAAPELKTILQQQPNIDRYQYDWQLNDIKNIQEE